MLRKIFALGSACLIGAFIMTLIYGPTIGRIQKQYMLEYCRAEVLSALSDAEENAVQPSCEIGNWDGEMVWFNVKGGPARHYSCNVDQGFPGFEPVRDCSFSN